MVKSAVYIAISFEILLIDAFHFLSVKFKSNANFVPARIEVFAID